MKKKLAAFALIIAIAVSVGIPAFAAGGVFHLGQTSLGIKVGESAALVSYYDDVVAIGTTWSSSNPDVATVDGNGGVTGVKLGQAVITATAGTGEVAQCYVHVVLKGIDVSSWQTSIDWSSVRNSGVDFAMIRTGLGSSESFDTRFDEYYAGAVANGLKVGVYHVAYATNAAVAQQEADFCLQILNGRHLDFPVAYDLEIDAIAGLSPDTIGQIVDAFCSRIQQAGYQTVVYTYVSFYNAHLTSPLVSKYDTWIANTGGVSAPNFSRPYTMWQYGQTTAMPGVLGAQNNACDLDYSYVDYSGSATTPVGQLPSDYFQSDTTGTYTFGTNRDYYYKITTPDTYRPTAVSSNPAAVTVQFSKVLPDGFLYKITSVGDGEATITTTAGDGRSVSFVAVGKAGLSQPTTPTDPVPPTDPSEGTLVSDTPAQFSMKPGSTYQFKFTPGNSSAYTFTSGNSSILQNVSTTKIGKDYYFKVKAVGNGVAGVYANEAGKGGSRVCVVTVEGTNQDPGGVSEIVSDTPAQFSMNLGSTYQFKFTPGNSSAYTFTSGNSSILQNVSTTKIGKDYYFKVKAVGNGIVGIYAHEAGKGGPRVCVVTVEGTAQNPAADSEIVSDTPAQFSMKLGSTYQFKFTPGNSSAYTFTSGNGTVLKNVSTTKIGKDYFYKVKAVGTGCVGVYGQEAGKGGPRLCVVTVS